VHEGKVAAGRDRNGSVDSLSNEELRTLEFSGAVAYVRCKTGVQIDGLNVHSELQRALAEHPRIEARAQRLDGSDDAILKTEYGKPFSADGFRRKIKMNGAGLALLGDSNPCFRRERALQPFRAVHRRSNKPLKHKE